MDEASDRLALRVGAATVSFRAWDGDRRPFYHFALLVPGDRFRAAHAWTRDRVELLSSPHDPGCTVFAFDAWEAEACYFHDPAGNIVELIAHHGVGDTDDPDAPFSPRELIGVSEIGIVTPGLAETAARLERDLGVRLWDGSVEEDGPGLAFVGRKAHTLILARVGRGWLPTGRPAEVHPVQITLTS